MTSQNLENLDVTPPKQFKSWVHYSLVLLSDLRGVECEKKPHTQYVTFVWLSLWLWLTAKSARRRTASCCHFTRPRSSKAFRSGRTQQVLECLLLIRGTHARIYSRNAGRWHTNIYSVYFRSIRGSWRQSSCSDPQNGRRRVVHVLLNGRRLRRARNTKVMLWISLCINNQECSGLKELYLGSTSLLKSGQAVTGMCWNKSEYIFWYPNYFTQSDARTEKIRANQIRSR